MRVFRSTGEAGFNDAVRDHPDCVEARKLEREVDVRFADETGIIQTHEGAVGVRSGDAIVTGPHGDRWRVSRARFADKYAPGAATAAGAAGAYRSRPYRVLARPMREPFEVWLADGVSRLSGRAGDWLVDYGDGSLGIVSAAAFANTYEVIEAL